MAFTATELVFNRLYRFTPWDKPAVAPNTEVHKMMEGATSSSQGIFTYFLTPLLPNITKELVREALI